MRRRAAVPASLGGEAGGGGCGCDGERRDRRGDFKVVEFPRLQSKAWTLSSSLRRSFSGSHPHRRRFSEAIAVEVARRGRHVRQGMDEQEFWRMLDLFPVVRSRDYCADPGTSHTGTTQQARAQEPTKGNRKDSSGAEDIFMQKLRLAAEKKIGATKAEFFCKAFEEAHEKLVYKELSLDTAEKFLNAKKFQ